MIPCVNQTSSPKTESEERMWWKRVLLPCVITSCVACAGQNYNGLSSILSSTGVISSSQADAILSAGGKLSKAATSFTPEQEYYLGRGVGAMIFSRYPGYWNPTVNGYLNRTGELLALHS